MNRILGGLLIFFGLLVIGVQPAAAQFGKKKKKKEEQVLTVRYSYEKWSREEPVRYVMIPRPTKLKKGDMRDRIRALFKILVAEKRNTYGKAQIAFKDDYLKSGEVYVYLDASAKQRPFHPIVIAETVYSFTENGAKLVRFPKVKPAGVARSEVQNASYVLNVPFWQVLPPAKIGGALVEMPDGSYLRAEDAAERLKKKDAALAAAIWKYVEQGGKPGLSAVVAAALLKLDGIEKKLLPVLESANSELRSAALDGLAGFDTKVVNTAVRKILDDDSEAELRDKAAAHLGKSKDSKFSVAAHYHALRSSDATVVAEAAKALGDSKESETRKQLLKVLVHDNFSVREAALDSLLKRKDIQDLIESLVADKISEEVKTEVARKLVYLKNKKAQHSGLLYLAVSGKGEDAANSAKALSAHKDDATFVALGAALKHEDAATRTNAADSLAKIGLPKGLKPLTEADHEDTETGTLMATAIRKIYAKQSLKFVLNGTKDFNAILKRCAVATLGEMVKTKEGKRSRKQILEALRRLMKAREAPIRAASADSFFAMAGKDVQPDILTLAKDDAVEVKRAVAHALRAFKGPEAVKFLLKYMEETDAVVLANASETLGIFKEKEALQPIINKLNHKKVIVRRAATIALVKLGADLEQKKPLLSFFSERLFDSDGDVRLTAIEGLLLVKGPQMVILMGPCIQDPLPRVKKAALFAMAATGHPSAVEGISGALEDDDLEIRRVAIEALGKLKRKEAKPVLEAYLSKEKDKSLSAAAKKVSRSL